ncbi:MAG: AAA family ATPase [Planctomycetota bacterium]
MSALDDNDRLRAGTLPLDPAEGCEIYVPDDSPEKDERRLPAALRFVPPEEVVGGEAEWLIDGMVPSGVLTILSGRDKLGKTLLAWELARAVAHGRRLFDREVRQGMVFFAALDDPDSLTRSRLDELGLDDPNVLRVATPGTNERESYGPELLDQIALALVGQSPALVVIDALYLLLPGGAEAINDAGRMGPIMAKLNAICADLGAAVILVTHDRKSGGDVAGSFAIRAATKQILRLVLPEDAKANDPDGPRRELILTGKFAPSFKLILENNGPGAWKLLGSPAEVRETDVRGAVLAYVPEAPGGEKSREIAQTLGLRHKDVLAVLDQLVTEGSWLKATMPTGRAGRPPVVYRPLGVPE